MDQDKLRALRDKYENAKGSDVFDPTFKKVADLLFTGDVRRKPYSDPPTLLDAPHIADALTRPDHAGIDIGLIGVPMDLGVTNRSGARFGPRAIRTMERVGPYNHVLDLVPTAECKVADLGDVPFRSRFNLHHSIEDIEAYYLKVKEAGIWPLSAGGDHSVTYPIMKALGRDEPVGMIHIDAHCDTAGEYDGAKFHHGGPFRFAVLDGVLDPQRSVQIGIRGSSEFLWEFSYDSGMTVIHIEDFVTLGAEAVAAKCREVVGDGPVYVTLDVDGLDPAYAPGTGTPEIGGILPREAQVMLRALKGLNIIGGDVVEVAPQYDPSTNTAQVAAQMMFEILCLMTINRTSQGAKG